MSTTRSNCERMTKISNWVWSEFDLMGSVQSQVTNNHGKRKSIVLKDKIIIKKIEHYHSSSHEWDEDDND